jgi:polar amino acid transport system substrate-binding protein
MLKALSLALALLGSVVTPSRAAEVVELFGDDSYPPYSYLENGEFKGIYVELLRRAGQKLDGFELKLTPVPWKRGIRMSEAGEAFGLFPPYRRAERGWIDRYSVALLSERLVLFCNSEVLQKKPRATFPADFKGLVIGINRGFKPWAKRSVQTLKIEEGAGNQVNLRKLAKARIDCYANDALAVRSTLALMKQEPGALPEILHLQLQEALELSFETAHIAYSGQAAPAYKTRFIQQLDAALLELQNSGELRRIIERYGG